MYRLFRCIYSYEAELFMSSCSYCMFFMPSGVFVMRRATTIIAAANSSCIPMHMKMKPSSLTGWKSIFLQPGCTSRQAGSERLLWCHHLEIPPAQIYRTGMPCRVTLCSQTCSVSHCLRWFYLWKGKCQWNEHVAEHVECEQETWKRECAAFKHDCSWDKNYSAHCKSG